MKFYKKVVIRLMNWAGVKVFLVGFNDGKGLGPLRGHNFGVKVTV